MSDSVISVQNLSKQYHLGIIGGRTLRDDLARAWARLRGQPDPLLKVGQETHGNYNGEPIWALRDVSFELKRGEVMGIIGRNGAGKSTLLKILSRITAPTAGRVKMKGRVASLLEVGTGFHPELTGRENIYLNGAILGMRKHEIDRKFDEIVDFTEIERFLDTPVKRYSSGMYVRLAFAVAAHLEPEILIVDEVLAVGDAAFQKKCLGKIGDVARGGRTVLFVSHNLVAVRNLCSRALWLEQGKVVAYGEAPDLVFQYSAQSLSTHVEHVWLERETAPGNEAVRLHRASAYPQHPDTAPCLSVESSFILEFEYWNLVPEQRLNLSLVVWNEEGVAVFNTFPVGESTWYGRPFPVGLFRSRCLIPGNLLNAGMYRVQLYMVRDQSRVLHVVDDVLTFELADVREPGNGWYGRWIGAVRPKLRWETECVEVGSSLLSS